MIFLEETKWRESYIVSFQINSNPRVGRIEWEMHSKLLHKELQVKNQSSIRKRLAIV